MAESVSLLRVVGSLTALVRDWWAVDLVFVGCDTNGDSDLMPAMARAAPGEVVERRSSAETFRLGTPVIVDGVFEGAFIATGSRCLVPRDKDYLVSLLRLAAAEVSEYQTAVGRGNRGYRERLGHQASEADFRDIIGVSPAMGSVMELVAAVSGSTATILITGESGTGKELIARSLHLNSPRKDRPFVALNCGAFQDQLLESELFGHVRGSFTGAVRDKAGLLESADGGALLLDEVGEMSLPMQVKLLRVLQEGTFYPVGAAHPKHVDVRVLAATHRDLEEMVLAGRFREDLYYRLNVIRIEVPPLRHRREDVPLLVEHFLAKLTAEAPKRLHPLTLRRLQEYPWPGNVRELQNEVERLVVLARSETLIPPTVLSERIREPRPDAVVGLSHGALDEAVADLERRLIGEGLKRTRYNKSRLARELGVSRTSLLQKIDRYGLERRSRPRRAA